MVTYSLSSYLVSLESDLESMSVKLLYQVNCKRFGYYLVRFLEVIM